MTPGYLCIMHQSSETPAWCIIVEQVLDGPISDQSRYRSPVGLVSVPFLPLSIPRLHISLFCDMHKLSLDYSKTQC